MIGLAPTGIAPVAIMLNRLRNRGLGTQERVRFSVLAGLRGAAAQAGVKGSVMGHQSPDRAGILVGQGHRSRR